MPGLAAFIGECVALVFRLLDRLADNFSPADTDPMIDRLPANHAERDEKQPRGQMALPR